MNVPLPAHKMPDRTHDRQSVLWGEARLRISRVVGRPLSISHPQLAAEAAGWNPAGVTRREVIESSCGDANSGMSGEATPNNRTSGTGCPTCCGRKVLAGFNDLATTRPELAAQAEGWDPRTVTAGSRRKLAWRCPLGHEWDAAVVDRTKGSGCPVCGGKQGLPGFNDLATTNPELVSQADGWDPTTVTAGTERKRAWRCDRGHRWEARVSHRAEGSGCPVCANKVLLPGYNDLATTDPRLAAEADGWDPTTVGQGSASRRRWKCAEGHEWETKLYSRAVDGSGCPICSGRTTLVGENDLATTHPDLAGWAGAPVDDLGFVDDEPVIVGRLKARCFVYRAVDIDGSAAAATNEVVVVVVHPVLVTSRRARRLDAPDEALVGEDAERVVHGLARDGTDLSPHELLNLVRRAVRSARHRA